MIKLNNVITRFHPGRKIALKLLWWQSGLAILTCIVFLLVWDSRAAWSALLAGMVCLTANGFFIGQTLRFRHAQAAKRFLMRLWLSETAKLILLGVLSVLSINYLGARPLPYMVAFIVNIMVFWMAPFIITGY